MRAAVTGSMQARRRTNKRTAGMRWLSTWFQKYGRVFQEFRSLTVAAPIRATRVSKRCFDTLAYLGNGVLSYQSTLTPSCTIRPSRSVDTGARVGLATIAPVAAAT